MMCVCHFMTYIDYYSWSRIYHLMYVCMSVYYVCAVHKQTNKQTKHTKKRSPFPSSWIEVLSLVVLPSPMKNVVISFSFALQVTKRGLQVTRLPHLLYLYGSKVPQGQAIR